MVALNYFIKLVISSFVLTVLLDVASSNVLQKGKYLLVKLKDEARVPSNGKGKTILKDVHK